MDLKPIQVKKKIMILIIQSGRCEQKGCPWCSNRIEVTGINSVMINLDTDSWPNEQPNEQHQWAKAIKRNPSLSTWSYEAPAESDVLD